MLVQPERNQKREKKVCSSSNWSRSRSTSCRELKSSTTKTAKCGRKDSFIIISSSSSRIKAIRWTNKLKSILTFLVWCIMQCIYSTHKLLLKDDCGMMMRLSEGGVEVATNHVEHDKVLKSIIIKLSMLIIIAFNSFFSLESETGEWANAMWVVLRKGLWEEKKFLLFSVIFLSFLRLRELSK